MTRDEALAFVQTSAATDASPTLTAAEVDACLTRSRVVDADGRLITDPGYVETIWGTRAVVLALDAKVAKAAGSVDVSGSGTTVALSQVTANLTALRRSWRSRMLPGTD